MFLEVPLAGLAARQRERGDRGRAAGGDRRRRPATSPARRRSTPPTSASTRSSPSAAGNELLLAFTDWILEVLQPQLIANISAARRRRGDPAPARATSSARSGAVSRRRPRRRCARTSRICATFTDAAHVELRAASSSHSWIAAHAAGPSVTGTPVADVAQAVLAVEQHAGRPTARRRRRRIAAIMRRQARAARPGRGAAGVQRDVAAVPAADEVRGLRAGRGQRDRLAVTARG